MPKAEFEAKFSQGAFFYTNCYLEYLATQNLNLTQLAQEIRTEISSNNNGTISKLTIWKYIAFVSSAIELFDDLALLTTHSANDLRKLQENIEKDTDTCKDFFHIGEKRKSFYTKRVRRTLISKALQIHNYHAKAWYKRFSNEDKAFVKTLLRRQVDYSEAVFSGIQRIQATYRLLHNKSKHSPGCIFIPETHNITTSRLTWTILITKSLVGDNKKRKSVPMSGEMLDVFCKAINQAGTLLSVICHQNMLRIRSFDVLDLPASLLIFSQEEADRYKELASPHSTAIHMVDFTMNINAKIKHKPKSFHSSPLLIWNEYFKDFQ